MVDQGVAFLLLNANKKINISDLVAYGVIEAFVVLVDAFVKLAAKQLNAQNGKDQPED